MKYGFGYRTLKTAIATPIAVYIAQLFGVSNIAAAGILTILCIQPSRKKSVLTAWERFAACIIAILFSYLFFEFLNYSIVSLGILFAFFIYVTVLLKIDKGILTGAVIILNMYHFGMIDFAFIYEQLLLILIGIGTGLAVNIYMPSLDRKLYAIQIQLEEQIKSILHEIALYIKEGNMEWQGQEITKIESLLKKSEQFVTRDKENHFLRDIHKFEQYFQMREKQFTLLKQMLPILTRIPKRDDLSTKLAQLFSDLSSAVHPGDTSIIFKKRVKELYNAFKQEPLPTSQIEFESRASLLQLLFLIESYLEQKEVYYRKIPQQKKGR